MSAASRDAGGAAGARSAIALEIIEGTAPRRELLLGARPYTIGRDDANDIVIRDKSVSRFHARLDPAERGARITDLGSANGVRINGARVETATVEPGDLIALSERVLLRLVEVPAMAAAALSIPAREEEERTPDERLLFRIRETCRSLADSLGLEALLDRIIDDALRLLQAERGAVIPVAGGRPEYERAVFRDAETDVGAAAAGAAAMQTRAEELPGRGPGGRAISRSTIERVVRERALVHVVEGGDADITQSMAAGGLRAVLAAPLVADDETIGVLYVDARHPLRDFSRADRMAFSIFADQAAIALKNARLYRDAMRANAELEAARRRLQDDLRQSQKLEAVGRLAGGIAHDFNNVLTAIAGYAELIAASVPPESRIAADVREIRQAVARAATLTAQLLAFARRQVLRPAVIDLNAIVTDMANLLRRAVGEHIELRLRLAPGPGSIRADRNQMEQAILNLALNARDAMPGGGTLLIETGEARLNEQHPLLGLEAGRYVTLAVADNGCGMDAETRAHLFEPFFTTKEVGKGTGLGLATVYGIVRQSGGAIEVESEPGLGSTFRIYLPWAEPPAAGGDVGEAGGPAAAAAPACRGSETVLVVEDEDSVRALALRALAERGYGVLEARNGEEALALARAHPGPLHLVVSDAVMPRMGGRALAAALREVRPEARLLLVSGYDETTAGREEERALPFLAKPFSAAELAAKVREVLDAPR